MTKIKGVITFCIIISLTFIACNSQKKNDTKGEISPSSDKNVVQFDVEVTEIGLVMKVIPETYDSVPNLVKLYIGNNTDQEAQYGAYYTIEYFNGDNWEEMPFTDKMAFIDILYIHPVGETKEYTINLYPDMANYEKGQYRIRKKINLGEQSVDRTAVFKIE